MHQPLLLSSSLCTDRPNETGFFVKEINQTKAVCSHYIGSPFVPARKAIQYSLNTISDM